MIMLFVSIAFFLFFFSTIVVPEVVSRVKEQGNEALAKVDELSKRLGFEFHYYSHIKEVSTLGWSNPKRPVSQEEFSNLEKRIASLEKYLSIRYVEIENFYEKVK